MPSRDNPSNTRFDIRVFRGLNLLEDARITDPGSFRVLQNIYRKAPGVLAARPGSKVYARGDAFRITPPQHTAPNTTSTDLGLATTDILLGATNAELLHSTQTTLNSLLAKGPRGTVPRALPRPAPSSLISSGIFSLPIPVNTATPNIAEPTISVIPICVNSLHRMYTDFGSRKFLIGAFDFEAGEGDKLFYVDESTYSTPTIRLMSTMDMTVGAGGEWSFIDYYKEDIADSTKKYYAIGTNEVGKPFCITLNSSNLPVAQPLDVDAHISGGNNLFAVRAMCVYNGSVVYGGFWRGADDGTGLENFSNYICFSQPGEPDKLAETDGELSDIRIGDTVNEPITGLVVNSVANDAQGIKGQLVVFTTKRVVTYDGLPPVSGNPTGVAFHSVALGQVGCVAKKTIAQTPAGILFLGTDGLVYIIPRFSSGGPIPVSRTVEPALAHLTLRQQRQCCAVYDDGHYKLSYPETNYSSEAGAGTRPNALFGTDRGNPGASIPNRQLWLDVREPLNPSMMDFGLVWTGPHTGMKYSAMCVANQHDDHNLLFAGSAIDGTLFQTSLEGVYSDPSPESVGTTVPLEYDIQTGQFDAGDIHTDKIVKELMFGLNVDKTVTVTSSIITSGEVTGVEEGVEFSNTVSPIGYTFSQALTVANVPAIAPADSYRFLQNHPAAPYPRGRTFRFRWRASPSSATRLKLSDLTMVFAISNRTE